MSETLIRPFAQGDAPAMRALLNAIIARGGTTAHQTPFSESAFAERVLAEEARLAAFVAVDAAGDVAGFQILHRHPQLPEDWADIGTYVASGGRRRGVGAALFAATAAVARDGDAQIAAINAAIRRENRGGLAFYSALGFVDYAPDAGEPPAGVVLKKRLPGAA